MDEQQTFHFGTFTLDTQRRELLHRGEAVRVGTRAFDLLQALLARHGRVATKDELMAEVWSGTVVEENNLAAQIVALRRILSADASLAKCIQAVPGRGYRFLAPVKALPAGRRGPASPSADPAGTEALSLVVLPFACLDQGLAQIHFAQGLSHTIATDLSRIAGLLVISPATAATFDASPVDAPRIGRELAVDYLLTGSVQRGPGRLRITAHLVEARGGQQIWSERFDGDDADLLAFQDRVTGRIANSLGREIFVAAARGGLARGVDPNSFDLLMRGIAADNRPQSLETLRDQESLFTRAVELDPAHAEAHARLARALLLQVTQGHAAAHGESLRARGVRAAEAALALAPDNARAHCAMGLVHVMNGDFERAVLANEAAIALDRNFALAHNNLGNSLVHLGDGAAALPAAELALRLDPRGPQIGAFWTTKGYALLELRDFEGAAASLLRARSANPMLPRAHVGAAVALASLGQIEQARRAGGELLRIAPHYRLGETMDAARPSSVAAYRRFYDDVLRPGALAAGLPV